VGNCEVGQVQEQDKEELIEDLWWRVQLWPRSDLKREMESEDAATSSMSSLPLSTLE
jgi:hypothetical protein